MLVAMSPEGKFTRVVARLPESLFRIGSLDQRWIVFENYPRPRWISNRPFWVYDVSTRSLKALPGKWPYVQADINYPYVPVTGRSFLADLPGKKERVTNVIRVPDGRRSVAPYAYENDYRVLWQGVVVRAESETEVGVYDATTWRLLFKQKLSEYTREHDSFRE
jgi:hypothetical protein